MRSPPPAQEGAWDDPPKNETLEEDQAPHDAWSSLFVGMKNKIENKFGRTVAEVTRTAVHEAGHAVVGRGLGLLCGQATCVPDVDEGEAGHAITANPWEIWAAWKRQERYRPFESVVRRRIMMAMAGREAEIEILGLATLDGDGDDRHWIGCMMDELLGMANDAAWDRTEARLRRATRAMVRRHRAKIVAVAEALFARGTLTGDEIDTLVQF